jgi:hypothetical protein
MTWLNEGDTIMLVANMFMLDTRLAGMPVSHACYDLSLGC